MREGGSLLAEDQYSNSYWFDQYFQTIRRGLNKQDGSIGVCIFLRTLICYLITYIKDIITKKIQFLFSLHVEQLFGKEIEVLN